jgi:uncharacterized membrane protein
MGNGLLGKIFTWGTSANYSDTTTEVWLAGLGFILVLAFLWSTVVRSIVRQA